MECPRCVSTHIRKNGRKSGKQNYICADCGRQFIASYEQQGYAEAIKQGYGFKNGKLLVTVTAMDS